MNLILAKVGFPYVLSAHRRKESQLSLFDLRSKIDATDLLSSSNATWESSWKHDSPLAALSTRPFPSKLGMALAAPIFAFLHFCIFAFAFAKLFNLWQG